MTPELSIIRRHPGFVLEMANVATSIESTIALAIFDVGQPGYVPSSIHRVRCTRASGETNEVVLRSTGGATGVHVHSIVVIGTVCFAAVGSSIVALSLPTLAFMWSALVDDGACFGVHGYDGSIISHGELEIRRLSADGSTIWSAGGADVFTGSMTINSGLIRVVDFNNDYYVFDAATGKCLESSA